MPNLLLLDDDRIFLKITQKSCAEAGIKMDTIDSFKKLKHSNLESYDGIIVDYDLGDGTGDEVLEYLIAKRIDKPVALISSTERAIAETSAGSTVSFISKWQDPDALIDGIRGFLAKQV